MRQILLQNVTAILLQMQQKFITKCVRFFVTKCDISQIATISLENATVITKSDVYYKLRQSSAHQFADASLFVHLAVNSMIKYHYH